MAVSACLVAVSQPRTSTSFTCSAEVTTARNRSRSAPSLRTSGFVLAGPPAAGRPGGRLGGPKPNFPSRTVISNPTSAASRCRSSQSLVPAWDTWS